MDKIDTRKVSWTQNDINHVKDGTLLLWNIGIGRPKEYPYNARNDCDEHRRVQFQSEQWDKLGTRFFTIPINRGNYHWAGVIVERHAPEKGYATLHYYDLLNNSDCRDNILHRRKIMEVIGESLNEIVRDRKKAKPQIMNHFFLLSYGCVMML